MNDLISAGPGEHLLDMRGVNPNLCPYCGNRIPLGTAWRVYLPAKPMPKEQHVCGRCFILIDINRILKEMQHGRPKRPEQSSLSEHDSGRTAGTASQDTAPTKDSSDPEKEDD